MLYIYEDTYKADSETRLVDLAAHGHHFIHNINIHI